MLKTGILNPQINSLLSRVRHTNMLVISDKGFPFWPQIETVDISLTDDIPSVLDVFSAIRPIFEIGQVYMAEEFLANNTDKTKATFARALEGLAVTYESHEASFKMRVPQAIGLIRTAGVIPYSNMILVSA
jgi:D-ribose pyranase